jgi:predicted amidohydrolase
VNRLVNQSAGRLPLRAVVSARRVTDVLAEIVDTSDVRPLDVYAVLSVRGTVTDYLPTTIRSYLAVDESLVDVPRASGRTPAESLLEQLEALEVSAELVLEAAQQQDVDALMTQGNFLRTKFSGSDLDL